MKKRTRTSKPTQAQLESMLECSKLTVVIMRKRKYKRPRTDQDLRDENARLEERRRKRKERALLDAIEELKEILNK